MNSKTQQQIWKEKMSARAEKIRAGPHKRFNGFSELNKWVNNPLNQKLYKIGMIDWVENLVQIEGRPINWK